MTRTYSLFLDDVRDPPKDSTDNWVICRDYREAMEMIESCRPDLVSLDHDLGEGKLTGYDFVKDLCAHDQLVESILDGMEVIIHSMNPVGARNMFEYLSNYCRVEEKLVKISLKEYRQ